MQSKHSLSRTHRNTEYGFEKMTCTKEKRTMERSKSRVGLAVCAAFWAAWMLLPGTSSATLPIMKKAKELGFPAENCLYCHNEKLPKKGAATHNERGEWL